MLGDRSVFKLLHKEQKREGMSGVWRPLSGHCSLKEGWPSIALAVLSNSIGPFLRYPGYYTLVRNQKTKAGMGCRRQGTLLRKREQASLRGSPALNALFPLSPRFCIISTFCRHSVVFGVGTYSSAPLRRKGESLSPLHLV
jgi:hypothetical protein